MFSFTKDLLKAYQDLSESYREIIQDVKPLSNDIHFVSKQIGCAEHNIHDRLRQIEKFLHEEVVDTKSEVVSWIFQLESKLNRLNENVLQLIKNNKKRRKHSTTK